MSTHKINLLNCELTTTLISTKTQLDQTLKDFLSTITRNKDNYKHVVGLDIDKDYKASEDGDDNKLVTEKVAILKLCFGTSCLIIQLLHLKSAPCSLSRFLQLQEISFVGVGIKHSLDALEKDYGIKCRNGVDLGELKASLEEDREMRKARAYGLLDLVETECYDSDVKRMMRDWSNAAVFSNWGATKLTKQQIEVATRGAFLCFCVGNRLFGGSFGPYHNRFDHRYMGL